MKKSEDFLRKKMVFLLTKLITKGAGYEKPETLVPAKPEYQ